MRILFSCSELGLGHVSRIIPLGKRLEQNGHETFFYSGGKAYELLKKEFRHVYKCTPIAWYENAHGIVTSASLINILFPLPVFNAEDRQFEMKSSNAMEVIHRYYDLRENLRDIAPDVLIADGDINALRLAYRWKIPSVYIANLIRPSYGFAHLLNPGERIVEEYVKRCTKIVIPDNPPPYTISDYNIGDLTGSEFEDKIEYVGAFMDTTPVEGTETHVFAPVSGPVGTRSKLIKTLLPVLQKTQDKAVISLGNPGHEASVKIGNCEIHNWLSTTERQEAMKNAKYVIFSGGHITCFETVKYGKPSICVPTQPEQGGNAAKLQDLGCSIKVKNQKELAKAVEKMEKEHTVYRRNMVALNMFSSRFHGLDRTVEIVENVAC
jgi:UDP-N-acetylglucosamine--N-acetylmuramyl-(pentapeptide) pyrophosphoryl-undecaprenol N-acetylglucosamine transferase